MLNRVLTFLMAVAILLLTYVAILLACTLVPDSCYL